MVASQERQSYKSIPTKNWWTIRKKFAQAMPAKVTTGYLRSILTLDEGAAQNLLAPLRSIGLIDPEGKPTELANDWRSDSHYADACERIVTATYPQELLDAFPDRSPDRTAVQNWFKRVGHLGEAAAGKLAVFFILLRQADVTAQEDLSATGQAKPRRVKRVSHGASERTNDRSAQDRTTTTSSSSQAPSPPLPQLHIDIQIHISADAKPDQIDQVFASMAKHLYEREAK